TSNHQSGISWSEQERFVVGPGAFRKLKGATSRRPRTESIVQHRGQHCRVVWSRNRTAPQRAGATKRRIQAAAAIAASVAGLAIVGTNATESTGAFNATTATARQARKMRRPRTHVVRRGDTLSKVAQRYGVSLKAMKRANPFVAPDRIEVGAILRIPQTH
ncbi:MAG: LysM peptidoglycan-binding domain-containing protein, partial [Myxococcota bacterium]